MSGALCCAAAVALAPSGTGRAAPPDEPPANVVGVIDGESIAMDGSLKLEVVAGQVRTVLHSGGNVRVNSGTARVDLAEGGQMAVCGPAHFSVLKSGGALTVALDSGTVRVRVEREIELTVYTPQFQARLVSIGGGAQEALVGLEPSGAMCVRAASGAVRIEQQLTGQSVLLPQGGNIVLTNGQIDSQRPGAARCSCELQRTPDAPPEVSLLASAKQMRLKKAAPAAEQPAAPEEPVYQVFMPPLAFDASAQTQPEPDPRLILLARRVRVRPTLIFRGRVGGEEVASAAMTPPLAAAASSAAPAAHKPAAGNSVVDRVRSLLHRIWTPSS